MLRVANTNHLARLRCRRGSISTDRAEYTDHGRGRASLARSVCTAADSKRSASRVRVGSLGALFRRAREQPLTLETGGARLGVRAPGRREREEGARARVLQEAGHREAGLARADERRGEVATPQQPGAHRALRLLDRRGVLHVRLTPAPPLVRSAGVLLEREEVDHHEAFLRSQEDGADGQQRRQYAEPEGIARRLRHGDRSLRRSAHDDAAYGAPGAAAPTPPEPGVLSVPSSEPRPGSCPCIPLGRPR